MDYEQYKVLEYDCWDLYLHANQYPYVGRCYAWARRALADIVIDMDVHERDELFEKVIPSWYRAVQKLFQCDRPNVAILGNEAPHLHAHLIPRYQTPRLVDGIEFVDPNFKGNYAPYPKKELPSSFLFSIRDCLRESLSESSSSFS